MEDPWFESYSERFFLAVPGGVSISPNFEELHFRLLIKGRHFLIKHSGEDDATDAIKIPDATVSAKTAKPLTSSLTNQNYVGGKSNKFIVPRLHAHTNMPR